MLPEYAGYPCGVPTSPNTGDQYVDTPNLRQQLGR